MDLRLRFGGHFITIEAYSSALLGNPFLLVFAADSGKPERSRFSKGLWRTAPRVTHHSLPKQSPLEAAFRQAVIL